MHYKCVYENVFIPGSEEIYAKCTSIVLVNVELLEWIPHHFVDWYMNIEGALVRPLRGFNGEGDESTGEVVNP